MKREWLRGLVTSLDWVMGVDFSLVIELLLSVLDNPSNRHLFINHPLSITRRLCIIVPCPPPPIHGSHFLPFRTCLSAAVWKPMSLLLTSGQASSSLTLRHMPVSSTALHLVPAVFCHLASSQEGAQHEKLGETTFTYFYDSMLLELFYVIIVVANLLLCLIS